MRVENASKEYVAQGQTVRALRGVSLEVGPGEVVALMGRSGCGKSTLLNLAGAMDFPTQGRVVVDGAETSAMDDGALTRLRREKVGFIFQNFQLLPTLSAVENVELPLLLAGTVNPRPAAREALDWVDLAPEADRMPHQLSGGQMQRVAIARALVHRPKLLLADEPIGNLDTATGDLILHLLSRAASERGAAVLMATHSLDSTRVASRVVRLQDGLIVA